MSLSLFIVDLERWALILYLLVSLDPTNDFECHDLQVRALAESHLFGGLFYGFGHSKAPHEQFGFSWSQVTPFEGKGVNWLHMWGNFECPRCLFFPNMYNLASFGCFLMMAVAHIRIFACAGWMRSSGERETTIVSGLHP